jgi:L-alanine-DL-glutamate epimerase-like enolase superfamily enzyme
MRGVRLGSSAVPVDRLEVGAYIIPTDQPEADGTITWESTTLVVVHVEAGGERGLGYGYADVAAAEVIRRTLAPVVVGQDALAVPACWAAMRHAIRNQGRPGVCSMAISVVDVALWDLKARLFEVPLVSLFGAVRSGVPLYGSGGFTSYSLRRLKEQLGGWAAEGFKRVKMKIGSDPAHDVERVRAAREAIGPEVELFVDANGAYQRKEALGFAERFAELGVVWFEEPVSSDDLEGLHLLRNRAPAPIEIAAGEYGYDLAYFRRMLEHEAVDCLQADGTRCGGFSEFLRVAALCAARSMPLSAHTAPTLHASVGCAVQPLVHVEYFHDHARIERMLFEGTPEPRSGVLYPDLSRPGLGLELKKVDAERYAAG